MNRSTDRPPVLRFLLMFTALLAIATGMAALSHSAEAGSDHTARATEGPVNTVPQNEHTHPVTPGSHPAHDPHHQP